MLTVENFNIAYPLHKGSTGKQKKEAWFPAVADINFSLAAGERLGIIGESGCGKSSLALGIMGLLRGAKVGGRVVFDGLELTAMKERELRGLRWRRIAIVFQNSQEVFNPVLSLKEQLSEPLRTHLGMDPKSARDRLSEILDATGLDPAWLDSYPHQLSGGMRQRALIAMALACRPELLIVDEPTTSLDPENRQVVLKLLADLQQRFGFGLIMISHNLSAVRRLTDRVLTMYNGRVVEEGETGSVLRLPLHPYTRGLINSSPELFPYKDLWGIPGEPLRTDDAAARCGCGFAPRCTQSGENCSRLLPELRELGEFREPGRSRLVACHKGGIETILSAEEISKTYVRGSLVHNSKNGKNTKNGQAQKIRALNGVSLQVRSGEVVALVGSSGSGKSTLAKILVRSLEQDSGQVRFRSRVLHRNTAVEVTGAMNGLQLVYQDPVEAISHRLTVLDAVREPLDIIGTEIAGNLHDRNHTAIHCIGAVHLPTSPDFLNRTCHGLSGGQRQRLAIARGLITRPALLIADEITSMLDPSSQAIILRELKGLQHSFGFSMLFISHDLPLARKVADRVYVLDHGYIVEEGASFEVLVGGRTAHGAECSAQHDIAADFARPALKN